MSSQTNYLREEVDLQKFPLLHTQVPPSPHLVTESSPTTAPPIREGVKKILVTDRSVSVGGESTPCLQLKLSFFLRKEKKMQNILKRKNVYLMKKCPQYVHLGLLKNIQGLLICISENVEIFFLSKSTIWSFTHRSATNFFLLRLPLGKTHIKKKCFFSGRSTKVLPFLH